MPLGILTERPHDLTIERTIMLLGEVSQRFGNPCWKTNSNVGDGWLLIHATIMQLKRLRCKMRVLLAQARIRLTAWVKTQRLEAD